VNHVTAVDDEVAAVNVRGFGRRKEQYRLRYFPRPAPTAERHLRLFS
jgi:hypothetical protein